MNAELTEFLSSLNGFTLLDADSFLERKRNCFDTNLTLVVRNTDGREKEVKSKIEYYFGSAELSAGKNYIAVLPSDFFGKDRFGYGDLIEIIRRLRDPDGCPWDRAQSPSSIRTNILEEAYELVEAVDLHDEAKIREECGDVLLQSAFLSVMTEEKGSVTNIDVISELCRKLIFRHTHIFGKDKAHNEQEALAFWEKAKSAEKGQKNVEDKLDSVPVTFTALQKANKVQKIIKKTGFDFPTEKEAIEKIYEETTEFVDAKTPEEREKEAGDMLFSVVNVLRKFGIDPEVALNGTTERFEKRFRYVVEEAAKDGKKPEEMTLDEMEKLYQQAKKYERK